MLDGSPCSIIDNEFVKPEKGQAFNRVKIRNLLHGRVVEKTFKSGESVEAADVMEHELQYSIMMVNSGTSWIKVTNKLLRVQPQLVTLRITARARFIYGNTLNNKPIAVEPPNFVILEIVEPTQV